MDLLNHLPAPVTVPVPVATTDRDGRPKPPAVEESEAISFPGMLDKKQEQLARQENPATDNQILANDASGFGGVEGSEEAVPGNAKPNSTGLLSGGQVMTQLMVRIQTGQMPLQSLVGDKPALATDVAVQASLPQSATPSAESRNPAVKQDPLMIDIQPTGGQGQPFGRALLSPGTANNPAEVTEVEVKPSLATGTTMDHPKGQVFSATTQAGQKSQVLPSPSDLKASPQGISATANPGQGEIPLPATNPTGMFDSTIGSELTPSTSTEAQATAKPTSENVAIKISAAPALADGKMETVMESKKIETQVAQDQIELKPESAQASDLTTGQENLGQAFSKKNMASADNPAQVPVAEGNPLEAGTDLTLKNRGPLDQAASGRAAVSNQGRQIRQQVIRQLSTSLDGRIGNEKVTLQLNPEKLGQVEIQFAAKGNDLTIMITTSGNEAEQAVREGIKDLAQGIADKSGRWQQVDIKVDQRGQDNEKNDNRQENRRDQNRRDQEQRQQPRHNRPQNGGPDWASLREEG